MSAKRSNILRSFSRGWPIALLLFLYLLLRPKSNAVAAPSTLKEALNQQFPKKYQSLINYWLAVSKMETADFSSGLYLNGNNPWGMKLAKKRPTTATGTQTGQAQRNELSTKEAIEAGYKPFGIITALPTFLRPNSTEFARYNNLTDAAKDIVLWMEYTKFPERVDGLLSFVQAMKARGYMGDESVESYINKVQSWQ